MDYSTPGFPVLRYLPDQSQTHVHWVDDTISSFATLFSFCLPSFPASRSFPMSWLFVSRSWSIGASASAVLTIIYFSSLVSLSCKKPKSVNSYTYFHVRAKGKAERFWVGEWSFVCESKIVFCFFFVSLHSFSQMKALRMKLVDTRGPYPGLEHVSYFLGNPLISVWHPWCLWILVLPWCFSEPYLQADLWNGAEGTEHSYTDQRNWILLPGSRARILMETSSSSQRLSLWQTSFPSVQESKLSINSFNSFYPALEFKSWPRA